MTTDTPLPPIVRENLALRELVAEAEALLAIANAPTEWKLADWDAAITQWCERNDALRTKSTEELVKEREEAP